MNTTRHTLYTPAPVAVLRAGEDACRALARWLRRRAQAWQRSRRTLARLRALNALSDGVLRDLGIDRSELHAMATDPDDATRTRISLPW